LTTQHFFYLLITYLFTKIESG